MTFNEKRSTKSLERVYANFDNLKQQKRENECRPL